MSRLIRQEKTADYQIVFNLIKKAFETETMSNHTEPFLVERLRKTAAFIPELSLVAELNEQIVGHILLTKIKIKGDTSEHESLALAPVSVLPSHQRKGIGTALIQKAHEVAKALDFHSIVLIGHENYYPKFGYKKAADFGITFPFAAPSKNCMAIELVENGLKNVNGLVEYPKAFFE